MLRSILMFPLLLMVVSLSGCTDGSNTNSKTDGDRLSDGDVGADGDPDPDLDVIEDDNGDTLPDLLPLHVEGSRIVDSNGGTVILRGVGVNQLGDYFQGNPEIDPVLPLEKRDFEQMEAMGLNSVRLVISWSFIEPERGVYDEAYIAKVKQAVEWARESRIYVIFDMHQDAWGKYIASPTDVVCEGSRTPNVGWDGAPEWATLTDDLDTCISLSREMSPAVERAWESFYGDRDDILQHFVDAWAYLASQFIDDPAVAGYDLLNEPGWGEDLEDYIQTIKGAFHQRCIEAIREVEGDGQHKPIFFEPSAMWSFYPEEEAVLFTGDPNIVYAPHIYNSVNSVIETVTVDDNFENAAAEAAVYGCPFWFGEWWGSDMEQAGKVAALEDAYQVGSARWIWKVSCGDPHFMVGCWPNCQDHLPQGKRNSVIDIQCGDPKHLEGVELGVHPTDAIILTRPYPRSFPSPATYTVDPNERSIDMQGDSPGDIPLVLWIPGESEPQVENIGIEDKQLAKVSGGWILTGLPIAGEWSIHAKGQ